MAMHKLYQRQKNWILESHLDNCLVESLKNSINIHLDSLYENTYSSAVKGENSTQYWIYDHQVHPIFFNKEFESSMYKLKDYAQSILIEHNLIQQPSLKFESVWSIIGNENSYCEIHDHPNICGVSVVLYLQIPENKSENHLEQNKGQIYFVLDSDSTEDFDSRVVHITPSVGKILIFPNWLLHGTYPQVKGIRQTLNTNLFT
jgi:hypothetical protein